MARFLHALPVAICDRCRMKVPHASLVPDGDNPALRVCPGCRDDIDPYKLPARRVEQIAVRHPRPDASLGITGDTLGTKQGQGFTITTESGDRIEVEE